jgi:EpsI family protein
VPGLHQDTKSLFGFLKSRQALIVTVLLLGQALVYYNLSSGKEVPLRRPLQELPQQFGKWNMVQEGVLDDETLRILRADSTLTRNYAAASQPWIANLYIAYFKSQKQGQTPHTPKHCLPGAGWVPTISDIVPIQIPGRAEPIRVNRYVLTKGLEKSVVFYWYQSNARIIASEYTAKLMMVADALRYRRTDTALVRVLVPVLEKTSDESATATAVDFIQSFFNSLEDYLPA